MSFEADLAVGVAKLLQANGLGSWRDTGTYLPAETGIFYRAVPAEPAAIITLSPYSVSDKISLSTSTIGLQVRTRAAGRNPRSTDTLADAIFGLLHGASQLRLATGILVVNAYRQSSASLGQDSGGQWSRSDNYYLDVYYPSKNRS